MKISRLIIPAFASVALLSACSEEPQESTKKPVNPEQPEEPTPDNPSGDIVSPVPSFTCNTEKTSIDPAKQFQTIEGFGASDCWLPNQIGNYWRSNRLQLARWLFSKNISKGQPQGIGLSMWRVNLGAGTAELGEKGGIDNDNANNRAESYLNGTTYDWTNKCVGQRYFMQQAKNNGVESFVLFSNSPLVQYTLNGQGRSDNGDKANIKPEAYGAFAEYMANVAQHFDSEGYNISHISPVNEPQYNWDGHAQEGSGWQNSEVAKLVRELDKAIASKGISTKILIPEAAAWGYLYEGKANERASQIEAFFNPSSENYVGNLAHVDKLVGGHSYWTFDNWRDMRNVRAKVAGAAEAKGLRVWQTEWSMLDKEPSELGGSYDNVSEFDIALYMSKIIHNDITVAGCTSWSYWTAMSVERWSQKNRFELIKTTPAGGNYSNDFTAEGTVEATPNLWVLGNYSLFIRPGYKRIALSATETKDFFGSAYASPDGNTVVAVYTNTSKDCGVTLDNTFAGSKKLKTVSRYTSSEDKNLKEEKFNIADKVFVDPKSVTTIVYTFE